MLQEKEFAPRLHVLMARDAPFGVVIRRGPSKQVCTIGWNRKDDTFKIGQWLKGRIYERRSDLSPDGKYMIYFAMNGHFNSESSGAWTALCQAPYMKAVGFWPQGNCWFGGGLFVDNSTFWLNGRYVPEATTNPPLRRADQFPVYVDYGGECPGVYYLRLLRDGWTLQSNEKFAAYDEVTTFEKSINDSWLLRKLAFAQINHPPGKGCYYDRHEIENRKTGEKIDGTDWEWAEVDGRRLVWAEAGKLFAARIGPKGMGEKTELFDFNPLKFERLMAPY